MSLARPLGGAERASCGVRLIPRAENPTAALGPFVSSARFSRTAPGSVGGTTAASHLRKPGQVSAPRARPGLWSGSPLPTLPTKPAYREPRPPCGSRGRKKTGTCYPPRSWDRRGTAGCVATLPRRTPEVGHLPGEPSGRQGAPYLQRRGPLRLPAGGVLAVLRTPSPRGPGSDSEETRGAASGGTAPPGACAIIY